MALLKCAKCGGKVSELAKRCPHCNCTIEEAIEGFSPIKVQNKPVMNVQTQKVNCPYEIRQGHLIRSIGVEGVAVIPDSVRIIDERAFENSLVTKVRFPLLGEVASIGKYAFRRCRNLQVMILPNGVNEIGEGCFEGCQNLERIIFSKSIRTIPSNAFSFCSKLKKITIPLSVEMIKEDAFIGTFIKEVTLPVRFKNQVSKLFPKATIVSFIEAESQGEDNKHSTSEYSQSIVALPTENNNNDECDCMRKSVAIPSQRKGRRIVCHKCHRFISANTNTCPYCSTKLPSDQPSCSATTSKNNNGSWLDSYLNNTLKVDSNPPKYHSLQENEIPEENVQMKERNYQKEAENVKKVDASSDLVDDWDDDNDYGPDSIGDCYAEYHAYD